MAKCSWLHVSTLKKELWKECILILSFLSSGTNILSPKSICHFAHTLLLMIIACYRNTVTAAVLRFMLTHWLECKLLRIWFAVDTKKIMLWCWGTDGIHVEACVYTWLVDAGLVTWWWRMWCKHFVTKLDCLLSDWHTLTVSLQKCVPSPSDRQNCIWTVAYLKADIEAHVGSYATQRKALVYSLHALRYYYFFFCLICSKLQSRSRRFCKINGDNQSCCMTKFTVTMIRHSANSFWFAVAALPLMCWLLHALQSAVLHLI